MSTFDLAIIGAGPGGYVCAFRAAQLGLNVALVERRPTLGGTCLNVGCIPSKALLQMSEHYAWAKLHAAASGIKLAGVELDFAALMKKKDAVVQRLVSGVAQLAKARKITVFAGHATLTGAMTVEISPVGGPPSAEKTALTARHIVLATGSAPSELSFLPFDGRTVVSSDEAIAFDAVPRRLVVVGGGAIGLELASVWSRLGTEVAVVEFLPKIAVNYDDDVARLLTRLLTRQGLRIEVNARVTGLKSPGSLPKTHPPPNVVLLAEREGQVIEFPADKILVCVGRRPVTENLGLERVGVQLDEKKRIQVDDHLRTSVPGVWAIGDVVAGPMLAHKAEEDGAAVAEWISGRAGHIDWNLIPGVIYTDPELAGVGLGEDGARAAGVEVRVGKFHFGANGRAIAADAAEGFVKIIAAAKTDRIVGAQIIGRGASELISEVVTHMAYGGSAEDLGRTVHAHPTLSEAVKEAGLAVAKTAIHAL
ncbi:MAG TPA: dihydrolipoyl dehydrogenase [Opitutaceae bacterium]|nr:dihydrolipoyl dehydrogenase [Opitutaceae bacterium]